jgi:hypothetical protein
MPITLSDLPLAAVPNRQDTQFKAQRSVDADLEPSGLELATLTVLHCEPNSAREHELEFPS